MHYNKWGQVGWKGGVKGMKFSFAHLPSLGWVSGEKLQSGGMQQGVPEGENTGKGERGGVGLQVRS